MSEDKIDKLPAFPAHQDLEKWYYQRGEGFGRKSPRYDTSFLIDEFTQLRAIADEMAEALEIAYADIDSTKVDYANRTVITNPNYKIIEDAFKKYNQLIGEK